MMKLFSHGIFPVLLTIVMLLAPESWAGKPVCGDGKCQGNEKVTCSEDCTVISEPCGDGICDPDYETSITCPEDCTPSPDPIPKLTLKAEKLDAHSGAVRAVGFTTDGGEGVDVISGGEDAELLIWNLELDSIGVKTHDHTIYDLDSSVDGSIVATGVGGWNGGTDASTIRIFNATNDYHEETLGTRAPIGYVYCVAISPYKEWTVASGFYGDIVVYDTSSLALYATKATKKKRTKALAFSPDGSILASTSTAGLIQLWSFPDGTSGDQCNFTSCELKLLSVSLRHSGSWAFPIAFYPKDDLGENKIKIASSTDSGVVKVWTIEDTTSPTLYDPISVDSGSIYCLDWSPDGKKIVAGGNGSITVYDADSLEILFQEVNAHNSRVNDVAFSSDSSMILSGGKDGALKLWVYE